MRIYNWASDLEFQQHIESIDNILGNYEKENKMEQIAIETAPTILTDEELNALLAKELFVTSDEAEETDAEKVLN